MKRVKLKTAAVLFSALAALCCAEAWAGVLSVKLTNGTDAKVFVALGQSSEGGDNSCDYSQGWWGVGPGETKTIRIDGYSPACSYDFYAVSKGGTRVWAGAEGGSYWIHPHTTFKVHPDDALPGGSKAVFRRLQVNDVHRGDRLFGEAGIIFALAE